MSEVIEEYIRRHPGLREADAFEGFLKQDRIKAWVGADESRKERLRAEFGRVWQTLQGAAGGTRGPVTMRETDLEMEERRKQMEAAKRVPVQVASDEPSRKLQLMCPACNRTEVWKQGHVIACRNCGRVYEDMLDLVPVKPVGPFAFVFGEGVQGWLTAGGIALLLLALYGVLRWL